jgi:hypothetical protein
MRPVRRTRLRGEQEDQRPTLLRDSRYGIARAQGPSLHYVRRLSTRLDNDSAMLKKPNDQDEIVWRAHRRPVLVRKGFARSW